MGFAGLDGDVKGEMDEGSELVVELFVCTNYCYCWYRS